VRRVTRLVDRDLGQSHMRSRRNQGSIFRQKGWKRVEMVRCLGGVVRLVKRLRAQPQTSHKGQTTRRPGQLEHLAAAAR